LSDEPPRAFRVMNEIGIVAQLGTTLFERAMPDGMTLAQFSILNHFARLGGEKSPVELARAFQVTKGTMTSTLQRLEAHGWIVVRADPDDGRGKRIAISPSGRRARDKAIRAVEPLLAELERAMTPGRLDALLPHLIALRTWLDANRRD
jgi:DNA-binding MarR family transcriptional regulator